VRRENDVVVGGGMRIVESVTDCERRRRPKPRVEIVLRRSRPPPRDGLDRVVVVPASRESSPSSGVMVNGRLWMFVGWVSKTIKRAP
jgi:hypothetical protein